MIKAFVFGKFLPFHKGHEKMISFALAKCDFLTVLVCCSHTEDIAADVRVSWIKRTFENTTNIEVYAFHYCEDELPNTSVSSKQVSGVWADVFRKLVPDHSIVITSKEYGNFIAEAMNIKHIPFDILRREVAVSATAIRSDLFSNWDFLPESVKPYFALKVVILGTESTGKTTLTRNLSEHYHCSYVLEAGRDIIADSNAFTYEDLMLVASEHARRIGNSVLGGGPLLIIDTDIHITMSYSNFSFKRDMNVPTHIYKLNMANLYIYLNSDAPYVQDGTRLSEAERNLLDLSHKKILREHNINFIEIGGSWESRMKASIELIDKLIAANRQKLSGTSFT